VCVYVQLWPVLSKSFEKYSADIRIIERCCRCVRFAIRCLGRNSFSLLEPLVSLVYIILFVSGVLCNVEETQQRGNMSSNGITNSHNRDRWTQ